MNWGNYLLVATGTQYAVAAGLFYYAGNKWMALAMAAWSVGNIALAIGAWK